MKSRDITLLTKAMVKAMVFPVVNNGCENQTIKKAECQRIDAFKNCGAGEDSGESLGQQGDQTSQSKWRSTLKIHWKDWCWSFSILVIWCTQMTHLKNFWCGERSRAEGEEGVRGWDGWTASLMQWTQTWANFGRWWRDREAWSAGVHGVAKSQTRLGDWTTTTTTSGMVCACSVVQLCLTLCESPYGL